MTKKEQLLNEYVQLGVTIAQLQAKQTLVKEKILGKEPKENLNGKPPANTRNHLYKGVGEKVAAYIKAHPNAKRREIVEVTGASNSYVSKIVHGV